MSHFAAFPRSRAVRWFPLFAVLAAVGAPSTADAARSGAYEASGMSSSPPRGVIASSGYSVPFTVAGGRVSSAGGGRVSGSVNRRGAVAVSVSVGASKASGGGRLTGTSGAGSWSGIIKGDRCSGTWQATRG